MFGTQSWKYRLGVLGAGLIAGLLVLLLSPSSARAQDDPEPEETPAPEAEPRLSVVGLSDGGLTVTIDDNSLDLVVTIVGDTGVGVAQIGASPLRVAGTEVTADLDVLHYVGEADVEQPGTELDEAPEDRVCTDAELYCAGALAKGESTEFLLKGELPRPGVYDGIVTLWADGTASRVPLQVIYQATTPSIEFDTIAPVKGDSVVFSIRETADRDVVLSVPELVSLVRVDSDTASFSVGVDEVRIAQLVVVGEDGAEASIDITDELTVLAGQTVKLRLTVVGLPDQGKFTGTVRLSKPGEAETVEESVDFLRRRPKWVALAIVLLSGIAAQVGRFFLSKSTERAKAQLQASRAMESLLAIEAGLGSAASHRDVQPVLAFLRTQVRLMHARALSDANDEQETKDEATALLGRAALLGEYAPAIASIESVEVRKDAAPDVAAIEGFFRGATDEELAKAAIERIRARALAGISSSEIERFATHLRTLGATAPESLKVHHDRALAGQSDALKKFATDADYVGAEQSLRLVRNEWARQLVAEVSKRVEVAPPFVDDEPPWQHLISRAASEFAVGITTDQAFERFSPMMLQYASVAAQELAEKVEGLDMPPPTVEGSSAVADAKTALERRLRLLQDSKHRGALTALHDIDAASDAYDDLAAAIRVVAGPGAQMSVEGQTPIPAQTIDLKLSDGFKQDEPRQPTSFSGAAIAVPPPREFSKRLNQLEFLVAVLAVALAAITALYFVWARNHTWGDLEDMLTLGLWAIGVQQLGNMAGIGVLRNRLLSGEVEKAS